MIHVVDIDNRVVILSHMLNGGQENSGRRRERERQLPGIRCSGRRYTIDISRVATRQDREYGAIAIVS